MKGRKNWQKNRKTLNVLRSIKVSTLVFIMSVFSFLFILIIGTIGFLNMKNMNKNMNSIYNNNLVPITRGAEIRASFLNMKAFTTQAVFSYDANSVDKIEHYRKDVDDYLAEYEKSQLTDFEKEKLNTFKSIYTQYLSEWDQANTRLSKGDNVSISEYNNFILLGKKAEDSLIALSEYNKTTANDVNSKSSAEYSKSINSMFFISAVSIFIFTAISYIVIIMMKKYSKEMINIMEAVAQGDFTMEMNTASRNEFGVMKKSLAKTIVNISDILQTIKEKSINIDVQSTKLSGIAEEMAFSSENTSTTITEVAKGTSSQAYELTDILEILNTFSMKLDNIVKAIEEVNINSKGINQISSESSGNMKTLISSVNMLSSSFKYFTENISRLNSDISKVNAITNVINSISEQTNLLALNAAIEAARAGQAGKGFSVVADEIRKLSEQSRNSASEINELIAGILNNSKSILETSNNIEDELDNQVGIINTSISSFRSIIDSINEVTPRIGMITSSAIEINSDKNDIFEKLEEASSIAEQVSASAQEISVSAEKMNLSSEDVAASSQVLSNMTSEMMKHVNRFKLKT